MLTLWMTTSDYMRCQIKEEERVVKQSILWRVIERDLRAASCFPNDWVNVNNIWHFKVLQITPSQHLDERWISWKLDQGKLKRSEGIFDYQSNAVSWKHHQSMVFGGQYASWKVKPLYTGDGLISHALVAYQGNKISSQQQTITIKLSHEVLA